MIKKRFDELVNSYGIEIALLIVDEIIKEYEENICNQGYDYDIPMWDSKKEEWLKIRNDY